MFFLSAVAIGLLVFFMCLIMKRLRSHDNPTPLFVIKFVPIVLTLNHLLVQGVIAQDWSSAIVQLIAANIGFCCYLYVAGDIHYYRMKHLEQREAQFRPRAPEDDPDWNNYHP